MTTPSKSYFIVIDKSNDKKDDLIYDINFFYLKSFKKKDEPFKYINEPFFKGTLLLGADFKDKIRPLGFSKITKSGSVEPINPRLFKKFLLADENRFIAFSDQTESRMFLPFKQMLVSFQFEKSKITEFTFCRNCLEDKKFTILGKNLKIRSINNRIICSDCALELVIKQAQLSSLIDSERIDPKLKNFFNHMILKFKDVNKVLTSFKGDFNPVKNRDITLYDIEKNPKLSKKYLNYEVTKADIPEKFKELLHDQRISTLLPIQALSLDRGLINEYKDQLIMAPTSAGKTLVGELAGISKIITKKIKMLYLVPIVALANVRTEEFKKRYKKLNLTVIKKIGESILEPNFEDNIDKLIDADIIVATYEAIDYILRSGNREKLGEIGTIVIDEIQTLIDKERGFILDGLIARLKSGYDDVQFLYLSATIGEPELLARKLNAELIRYNNRPVPVERHLLLCLNETVKHKNISKLVRDAFRHESSFGYKGQSIIFTNSRKKCESLSTYLKTKGINVRAYHSGLTTEERKQIELEFQSQKIAGVVATAALAAGVDFPAKQVIFESLAMGINILTVAEFEQMLGRAGRLKKHELGRAYILVEPGKIYSPKLKLTEENVAISLLNGKIKDFELDPDEDKSLTELLAFISMLHEGTTREEIFKFYGFLINDDYDVDSFLNKLRDLRLVKFDNQDRIHATSLSIAIAKSFLTVEKSLEVIELLKNREASIIDLVLDLKPLKNVYLSKKVVADLSKNINMKYFSNNFFSASVLSLMDAEYVKKRKTFSTEFIDYITKWTREIFNCNCKDKPYCDCGRLNLERLILELRIDESLSVGEISSHLETAYKILVFKGDIIDYLENLIYSFESLLNIAKGITIDPKYNDELAEIPSIIKKIKNRPL